MKKTQKEIAHLLYTHPQGLTGRELQEKASPKRPIKVGDPAIANMLANGVIVETEGRYMLTDIGQMAYID